MRLAAVADLKAELRDIHGKEYSQKNLYSDTFQNQDMDVLEDLTYDVHHTGTDSWNESNEFTIASFIVTILGVANPTSALIGALSIAFAVASMMPAKGSINFYSCAAQYCRYVTVNDSIYAYNTTYKHIEYEAYEDASDNSEGRPAIDTSSKRVSYTVNSSYFSDYDRQIEDAYDSWEIIGQKP